MAAPVTVIVAYDMAFYEKLPLLFPHTDAKSWFDGKPQDELRTIALRNGSLQGAYLFLAARALGLDCGPMSGFDNAKVDAAFFAGTTFKSNFLVNLGHGDPASIFARSPRLFRRSLSHRMIRPAPLPTRSTPPFHGDRP